MSLPLDAQGFPVTYGSGKIATRDFNKVKENKVDMNILTAADKDNYKEVGTTLEQPEKEEWRNSFVIINTSRNERFALEAGGDRVIVQEDRFRTGYECKTCDGNRYQKDVPCPSCKGLKYVGEMGSNDATVCRLCQGSGLSQCPDCKGKGGVLIVPEDVMRRPTSGIIKSIGYRTNFDPDMMQWITDSEGKPYWKVGDRVIFALFAGTAIDFKQRGSCRILSRNELMGKIHGVGSLGDAIK